MLLLPLQATLKSVETPLELQFEGQPGQVQRKDLQSVTASARESALHVVMHRVLVTARSGKKKGFKQLDLT